VEYSDTGNSYVFFIERSDFVSLNGKKVGISFTGSFCTYSKVFPEIQQLTDCGAEVQTIFSEAASGIDSRFGKAEEFIKSAEEITGKPAILSIKDAEPIGPKGLFDVMAIIPCTGNTMAKLANGITDTPVLMAAKAHLRNDQPLVISISTNDALGINMKNIGLLLNAKNIYFVPFGQDDPVKKPCSMIASTSLLIPTLEAALAGQQYQPIINGPQKS